MKKNESKSAQEEQKAQVAQEVPEASVSSRDDLDRLAEAIATAKQGGLHPIPDLLEYATTDNLPEDFFPEKDFTKVWEASVQMMGASEKLRAAKYQGDQETVDFLTAFRERVQSNFLVFLEYQLIAMGKFRNDHAEELKAADQYPEEIRFLAPFILLEIITDKSDVPFEKALEAASEELKGNIKHGALSDLIHRALQHYHQYNRIVECVEAETQNLPANQPQDGATVITRRPNKVHLPVDIINTTIWPLREFLDGQLSFNLTTTPQGHYVEFGMSIDLEELQREGVRLSKTLTLFDKRVYTAANAEFKHGNDTFSLTSLWRTMGNTGRPKSDQLSKINASLTKLRSVVLWYNNKGEQGTDYTEQIYDGPLLPFERISARINGKLTDSAVHLFRQPPLMTFAEDRKQLFSVPIAVLQSPINKTEQNLAIDDYLLTRISHMKSKTNATKAHRKILFSTLFEKCGIKTPSQRSRAKEPIRKYLDHYQKCGFIAGYEEKADGITISL